ncbi:MAG: MerR family transcriptional regulator [Clostridia bacterium]|nr:MerR family transcriptional regulator [Clostridia bacterium]
MKMKEVLAQTGLTDRAVRLYIDNGLIAPDIEENYSGRKNIEFSQSDIDRLKNIALLRKIGFSIPDIKEISQGGENAKTIIEAFIQQKQENIESDTLVLEQLKNIPLDTKITMESLCLQLSSAAENKQVPKEDLQLPKAEKRRREDYIAIAIIGIIAPLIIMTTLILLRCVGHKNLVFDFETIMMYIHLFSGWFIIIVLSLVMLLINRPKFVSEKKQRIRKHLSRILFSINTFAVFAAMGGSSLALMLAMHTQEYTTDPNDYMSLGSYYGSVEKEEILKVFPSEIPESQVMYNGLFKDKYKPSTVYYYHNMESLDDVSDIFAQWQLPRKEFLEEVKLKQSSAVETVKKGNWIICYYIGNEAEEAKEGYYNVLAFAYNENSLTVRYMYSANIGYSEYSPYYLSMDW